MKIWRSVKELRDWRKSSATDERLGFVPTMGALHEGHGSLYERARKENDVLVASIFINPTQFNNKEDLTNYPRRESDDLTLLEERGVDGVFIPLAGEMYSDGYRFSVHENSLSKILCGASRPGHFEGMLTVVLKLFHLVEPTRAYFGEKDFQQLQLIKDMVAALFLPIEIVPCPTVREADGLAMSSRNLRLSAAEREIAPRLYKILKTAANVTEAARELSQNGFQVDYVEEHWGRRFAAASLGPVRLIDNVEI